MKSRYILLILSLFSLVITSEGDSSVFYTSIIIHSKAELGKVCLNPDGSNTILSKSTQNPGNSFISKILSGKRFDYQQSEFNFGYDMGATLMPTKNANGEKAYTLYTKSNGREYLTELKDKGENIISREYNTYHAHASTLSLKNGVIFFAGINPASKYALAKIDIKTYSPQTRTELNSGFTLNAYSHLVSCAEINDNEVYCAYVQKEELITRHLLYLQYFRVSDNGAIYKENEPYLIKSFYTDFNMLKVVKISSTEVGIAFQTGNGNEPEAIPYGNTGKDLYFYHLQVSPNSMQVIRYDYIYNNCRLRTNDEDYTVDIIALQNSAYAICEVDNEPDAFQLIRLYGPEKKFEQAKINNLGKEIRNPQFVKMGNTIGILYTRIDSSNNKDVMLLMVNYPDCQDATSPLIIYPECPYGINQLLTTKMEPYFKAFISNPYLKYTNEPLYYRFVNTNNIKIFNGNSELVINQDYALSTLSSIYITEFEDNLENTYIEYTVVRKENGEAVLGGTCRINVEVPKCWEGCIGCEPEGNDIDNRCFDCKHGYHYIPTGKDSSGLGCGKDGKIYNCDRCDIACTECFGPFDEKYPTTNCNYTKCNFDKGYFPLEYNTTICFNESDKEEWEDKLNLKCTLFLDKSQGAKEKWVWTCCDPHCASCHLRNTTDNDNCDTCKTSEGFFFYLNQTTAGGIPGNCHESCEGEGCYKCEDEGMDKMCPCLDQCKVCKNKDFCEECWRTWLLQPEKTSCNKTCEYCYTPYFEKPETKEKGRCVNCKTDFDPPQYTFNNQCYTEKPSFQYTAIKPVDEKKDNKTFIYKTIKKDYHVIDETCNLLTGCKEGCFKCSVLESDRCTECEDGYYKEDGKNNSKTFECYSKKVCRGNFPYPHDEEIIIRIGGVDYIEEDGSLVCLNCRLRNESFRQPEDEYWCGPNRSMTYVDIEPYNKLSKCYVRCKTCDKWGHACAMACTSCRDSKYYDLIRYDKTHGQCYRKQHKCGIYPYWHNYELAVDEDDCGEDCDVCLYNFQCPKEFPYFKFETHECVEFCPMTDVLAGNCNVNSSAVLLYLLKNPFGLRNPYEKLNREVYLHELLASNIGKYFANVYPEIDLKNIFNYIGTGKVYNLPESKIIVGNNISIELSSVKLELEKIADYLGGCSKCNNTPESYKPSGLDLSECEKLLKKKYNLPAEEDLIIIKADLPVLLKEANISYEELFGNNPNYQVFSVSLGAFLPLSVCSEDEGEGGYTTVYNPFQTFQLENFQSKIGVVVSNGYDIFNANSPFYNDVCTPFTNENGNDVLLDARRQDYYDENINLCDRGCAFIGYNTQSKTYICKCNVQSTPGEDTGEFKGEIVERVMPENFKDLISRRSNIAVFKCASQVFSAKGQKGNYGSYILLAAIAAFIGVLVFHFVKEKGKAMAALYNKLGKGESIANPPKGNKKEEKKKEKDEYKEKKKKSKVSKAQDNEKKDYDDFINKNNNNNVTNAVVDIKYEDDLLNFAPYSEVISRDYRSLLQTYWSFLKFKQSILFTFYTKSDGILRSTKIALFILFFAFYMAFTALFFNDSIMRALYIYKGNTDAAVHVPNIILSSLCSFIASIIVRYVCLGERDIYKILTVRQLDERKKLAKRAQKIASIKLIVLYVLSGILILLFWYYVSAFCAVFKNSQKNYLINFVVCFIVCNLWPVITSFIPATMRRCAIDGNNECLYKASQIVSVF